MFAKLSTCTVDVGTYRNDQKTASEKECLEGLHILWTMLTMTSAIPKDNETTKHCFAEGFEKPRNHQNPFALALFSDKSPVCGFQAVGKKKGDEGAAICLLRVLSGKWQRRRSDYASPESQLRWLE